MKTQRHRVNFLDENDVEAVALAQLGQSTAAIRRSTGLTACQVTYRLTKAKTADGLPRGTGYRRQWQEGMSPLAEKVRRIMLGGLRRDALRRLPPKFGAVLPHRNDSKLRDLARKKRKA